MTTIHNDTRREDFFANVKELGKAEGKGAKARPDFAVGLFLAAADQLIVSNIKELDKDDVRGLVADYFKELAAGRAEAGLPVVKDTPDSITQQESRLRSFPNMGGLPMFRSSRNGGNTIAKDWIALVKARIIEQAANTPDQGAPRMVDKMYLVNTAQKKKFESGKEEPLTSDEIDAAIAPKSKDISELKDLKKIDTALEKFLKAWPNSSKTVVLARAALAPRISELHGFEKAAGLKATLESMTPAQLTLIGLAPVETPAEPTPAPVETPAEPTPAPVEEKKPAAPRRNRGKKANGLSELENLVNA